jgi:hypothetical protein
MSLLPVLRGSLNVDWPVAERSTFEATASVARRESAVTGPKRAAAQRREGQTDGHDRDEARGFMRTDSVLGSS